MMRSRGSTTEHDDELRQRIVDVAARLFAENGYGGTRLQSVAAAADVTPRTVRRLTGRRPQLLAEVMAQQSTGESAARVASAVADPAAEPPLAVLLDAVTAVFAAPERSWSAVEVEAIARSRADDAVRAVESARFQERWTNVRAVSEQAHQIGTLDAAVDDDAFVHFALALSVGLAAVAPVVGQPPALRDWNALMARIGAALGTPDVMVTAADGARLPWRLRVDVPHRPGGLAQLIRRLSSLHVLVVAVAVIAAGDDTRTVDVALTAPASVGPEALLAAALASGRNGFVTKGTPEDHLDLPTRVLDGITELVANPGSAPLTVATLVEADGFVVTGANEGQDDTAEFLRLQWNADRHVVLHRDWAPFAGPEKSRASALLRLAAEIARIEGDGEAPGWIEPLEPDGTVVIRLARPEDADHVAAMHARCSEQTLYRRYLTGVRQWREVSLRRLTGGHRGVTLVVLNDDGSIVALGHLFPDLSVVGNAAEIAVIVEDAYQGRGIGTRVVRHLLELAERLGFDHVAGTVLAQNAAMLHLLEASHLHWHQHAEDGIVTVRAHLRHSQPPDHTSCSPVV